MDNHTKIGEMIVTVETKLRATLSELQGVAADFKNMYLESPEGDDREMFNTMYRQAEDVSNRIKHRIEEIEDEEPQYRREK